MKNQSITFDTDFVNYAASESIALFTKINSILGLMLLANENSDINQSLTHGALWAVSDYMKDLENLCEYFNKSVNDDHNQT